MTSATPQLEQACAAAGARYHERVVPLPVQILRLAESHSCFSGCYGSGDDLYCLVDPTVAPMAATAVQCMDCLSFRIGGLLSQLGNGMTRYQLARELSDHMRAHRGYAMSFGGYHTSGGGFWLSAAYWANIGVFVLNADRGTNKVGGSDVDLLVRAFSSGVAQPPDSGMLDPQHYASHRVFLNPVGMPKMSTVQALLSSAAVSHSRRAGFVEVTVAEYLPVSRALGSAVASAGPLTQPLVAPIGSKRNVPTSTATGPSSVASAGIASPVSRAGATRGKPAARRALRLGQRCDVCGEVVKERVLFTSVYVGCGCG